MSYSAPSAFRLLAASSCFNSPIMLIPPPAAGGGAAGFFSKPAIGSPPAIPPAGEASPAGDTVAPPEIRL